MMDSALERKRWDLLNICRFAAAGAAALCALASPALAGDCPGNPDALGTSRVMTLAPGQYKKIGTVEYPQTLPLEDHEIVLTFDDGPLPPHTLRVLDALAAECVKATFFVVGEMARNSPEAVRRAFKEGHTIATHTEHHAHLDRIPYDKAVGEITGGINAAAQALGDKNKVAPFFRFPYLDPTDKLEAYAVQSGLTVISADSFANDWIRISPQQLAATAIDRIERRKRGIFFLHDIHERTAIALPIILRELKKRGYRVVHIVAAPAVQAQTETKTSPWAPVN
jgi:peptidoglycan/xylan/chitin deacetylase (PgdA/CDA1 family)